MNWVLGEQSAKSLRGAQMRDVIFAGTHDRKPLGMAEVTLTLADPDVYEDQGPVEPQLIVDHGSPVDWDEDQIRRQRAAEAEEIVAAEQPGQVILEDDPIRPNDTVEGPQPMGLKIRRRRFQRVPLKGEIVVTRRLFGTGESEYLLNGKLCRLRDIQDIFMGTGLGPDSYAIIGQEQIGQILNSKPYDRRAIIEEAAGITGLKTKRRLAERQLERSKLSLAHVDDIFDEVTRQMDSLKRQAAKAERLVAAREGLRGRLRVVLASRMALMDAERTRLQLEIDYLTKKINCSAAEIDTMESSQHTLTERGYELAREGHEAQSRASSAALELERAVARERNNVERVNELEARLAATATELELTRSQLCGIAYEQTQQCAFLEKTTAEVGIFCKTVEARLREARAAAEEVMGAERQLEANRLQAMHLVTLAGDARNSMARAEESLGMQEREADRQTAARHRAQSDLQNLRVEIEQAKSRLEVTTEALRLLAGDIAALCDSLQANNAKESDLHARANQLRGERAGAAGRRNSLEVLIRDHSYSSDTVQRLLQPGALGQGMASVGTLADLLEVRGEHEGAVDEFLREELNYVVVDSWDAAEEGVRLVKSNVDDRVGPACCNLSISAKSILRARRGGRPAGREQRGPVRGPDGSLEQGRAVPSGHSLQTHDAVRRHDLRRDHAGARRLQDGKHAPRWRRTLPCLGIIDIRVDGPIALSRALSSASSSG
jgi:chromosome segregation protein